jgi:transposase-like protein
MKRTTTKTGNKAGVVIVPRGDEKGLKAYFAEQGQLLLPMLELLNAGKQTIQSVMHEAGRAMAEALLMESAKSLAGEKRAGASAGEVLWHGSQAGRITLLESKLKVSRPRLRTRGAGAREVSIPLYGALQQNAALGRRMSEILVSGVSTRNYRRVLPAMAHAAGISKSSVSRAVKVASEERLKALMERPFTETDILAVYLDGIEVSGHHIVAAVGLDEIGEKHVLGVVSGSSENARVVKDLLTSLVKRGIGADRKRLFVIDGSKAIRSAVEEIYGEQGLVQRCRAHKVRNVTERLPEPVRSQVKAVMHAAYKLPEKDGMAKLRQQASWLKGPHPDAAASLLEGLEETFTINRLKLTPRLMRCLATTNIIENPNGAVRRTTNRICRWRDPAMALRWTTAAYLEAEKRFRRVQGHAELWVLAGALDRNQSTHGVADHAKAA